MADHGTIDYLGSALPTLDVGDEDYQPLTDSEQLGLAVLLPLLPIVPEPPDEGQIWPRGDFIPL